MAGKVSVSAVHLDRGAIYRLLNDPRGPVGIAMMRLGRRIVQQAQAIAPVESGKLKSSIHISLWPGPRLSMEITANTPYAYYVH